MRPVALRLRCWAGAMKLLRSGGDFADRHIRHSGKKALWYFVGCAAVCALFFFVSYKLVALLGLVLAFKHFTAAYDQWEHWFLGKRGELAVTRALRGLPDGYVLLNDLMLPKGRGNVDHLLIGPNGLFVIETKNYAANVRCDGEQWFVNEKRRKSLSLQAKSNAVTVRNSLQELFSDHQTRLPFVEPLLVFVKHKHRLELNQPTIDVLKPEELVSFICDYERRSRFGHFSPELTRAIVHYLHSLQNHTPLSAENVAARSREANRARL
jgi:hypothetical protein